MKEISKSALPPDTTPAAPVVISPLSNESALEYTAARTLPISVVVSTLSFNVSALAVVTKKVAKINVVAIEIGLFIISHC